MIVDMINTTKIDINILELLGGMYQHALWNFSIEPDKAPLNKQKKIRKWINKQYADEIREFSGKLKNSFSDDVSDVEFFDFLKECCNAILKNQQENKLKFSEYSADLSDESRSALCELLHQEFFPDVKQIENDCEVTIDDYSSFRRILVLKNAVGVPYGQAGSYVENIHFDNKDGNRYRIFGEIEDLSDENTRPFNIMFTDAEVKVEFYNCVESQGFCDNPWIFLRSICFNIDMKAGLSSEYCNSLELELLPLVKEIIALEFWVEQEDGFEFKFTHLKNLSEQHGFSKITQMLTALGNEKAESKKYNSIVKRLISKLCEQKCEPLWGDIFDRILKSQSEYPNKADVCCPVDILSTTRADIQKLMEEHGYSGTYPDFIKKGQLKGIHLEDSYDTVCFVGMEKNVVYHVRCFESLDEEGYLEVQFLSGTALLRKDESADDIYSCLFNAKGRRLFWTVHCYTPVAEGVDDNDDIEQCVNIAVKKAEIKKLTKEERREYHGKYTVGLGLFFAILLVAGLLFGTFMTLAFMVIELLVILITGQPDMIIQMFLETPWWCVFLFCWIAFGSIMGIITMIAKRK